MCVRERDKEINYKELAHVIVEAEMSSRFTVSKQQESQ